MLKVEVDTKAVAAVQQIYNERGTASDIKVANAIRGLRMVFEHGARSFERSQSNAKIAGHRYIPDARLKTLQEFVVGPDADWTWPSSRAGVLHGLRLSTAEKMPHESVRGLARTVRSIDPHSYIVRIDAGPPQARQYGEFTALAVYLDPFRSLRIRWVGLELDYSDAMSSLEYATTGFLDWAGCFPDYDAWLRNKSAY